MGKGLPHSLEDKLATAVSVGLVKKAASVATANSSTTVTTINNLIASLKAAGIMA